ncbi:hypothetical protein [Alkalitalea saponilacus]|nr:hypothetical protein [Alkalitalea saponilacus]
MEFHQVVLALVIKEVMAMDMQTLDTLAHMQNMVEREMDGVIM